MLAMVGGKMTRTKRIAPMTAFLLVFTTSASAGSVKDVECNSADALKCSYNSAVGRLTLGCCPRNYHYAEVTRTGGGVEMAFVNGCYRTFSEAQTAAARDIQEEVDAGISRALAKEENLAVICK
jgi:hypothetical protein